jgi:hypothetical protein
MSEKSQKWEWKLVGKAWAIIGEILNRTRNFTEKDGGLDWAFLAWLAKAPDSVYEQALGGLLNAWQASMAAERNQNKSENLEWNLVLTSGETWQGAFIYVDHSPGNYRLPTAEELMSAVNNRGLVVRKVVWTSQEVDKNNALAFFPTEGKVLPAEKQLHYDVILVREKRKQLRRR